jgi:hypothetical protein
VLAAFISIAAAGVKPNAAAIGLAGAPLTSNQRLKSKRRDKPRSLTIIKRHTAAAI